MILNNYFSLLSKQLLGLVGFNMKNKEKGLYHTRICVCILKIQQSVELCINFNIYFSICFLITTCFKYFFFCFQYTSSNVHHVLLNVSVNNAE